MRLGDSTVLDHPAATIADAHALILDMANGKRVLNVGAAGNATFYRDHGVDGWLHARLALRVETLMGLDLDGDEVQVASSLGYDIHMGNCETANLGTAFDLIVLADVLEHVDNPALALANMMGHLHPGGQIVLTTPNATFLGNVLNALLRRGPHIYWDHVNLYVPENIQVLCDRNGWTLAQTFLYSMTDKRTMSLRLKSILIHGAGMVFPRLHSAFLCIVEANKLNMEKDGF